MPKHVRVVTLHRLAPTPVPFLLNPDLILIVEATPDTIVTLTTGVHIVITETPDEVARTVRAWRAGILADALGARPLVAA